MWLDTQKKNKCYDSKNNVEKPHDSLGGKANRLEDVIDSICGWYAYVEEMELFVIYMYAYLWTPHFRSMRFPLDGELDFYLKNWVLLIEKMTWSRHLFLFYFLKGKQNKKEKP